MTILTLRKTAKCFFRAKDPGQRELIYSCLEKKQEISNCLETADLKNHWKLVKGNLEAMIFPHPQWLFIGEISKHVRGYINLYEIGSSL